MTAPHLDEFHGLVESLSDIADEADTDTITLLDRYLLFVQIHPGDPVFDITPAGDDLLDTVAGTD